MTQTHPDNPTRCTNGSDGAPRASAAADRHLERPLVLVVEDNERNARLMVTMMESAGYRSLVAVDGNEGVRMAVESQPALIITDLQMPGLDGVAMTRALKARADTSQIPIIAVSGHALSEHSEAALSAGCRSFLTKPFRYRVLLSEVADALGNKPASTSS